MLSRLGAGQLAALLWLVGAATTLGRQIPDYPPRAPVAPEILARGKTLYEVHCAFCHGADARGGTAGGPNLLRSQLVLSDKKGELIGEVVRNGRPGTPMVAIALSA